MRGYGSHPVLLGRSGECEVLARLVAGVRAGHSESLVVRGDPGVGKTALLEHLCDNASGCRVARANGVESEMELAYAGLHQLCLPFLDGISELPGPQANALRSAFGLSQGEGPDRFLVGLAVLTMLSEVAADRALIAVIDDAQWLDRASAQVLAFVARRLRTESVALVLGIREPNDDPDLRALPQMRVPGLGEDDARTLLERVVAGPLDTRVRDRLVAETHGNPLALLELPRNLSARRLAGGFGLPGGVTASIEESFRRRLQALPEAAGSLLLLAAAEPTGDPLLLWRAAERIGVGPDAAEPVETAEFLTFRERVVFRHPLVRSAVYRAAPTQARRAAHLALAEVTDPNQDAARRAWHLAASAPAPDEEIALELERSAGQAQGRGGLWAAAALLQRSVELTADPSKRADRALRAAGVSLSAGAFDEAMGLLATAHLGPLDEQQLARVELLRGQVAMFSTKGGDAASRLLGAAGRLERIDVNLARDTYLDAWGAALVSGSRGTGAGLLEVSRAARSAPPPEGPPRPSDVLLDSLATLITDGRAAATALLEEATRTFANEHFEPEAGLRWGWLMVQPTYTLWDEDSTYAICTRQLGVARRAGELARLPLDLATLSALAVRCGDFARAEEAIAETVALTDQTGVGRTSLLGTMLAAFRGREVEARVLMEAARREASAMGEGTSIQLLDWMLAVLCNGLGRYTEALEAAQAGTGDLEEVFASAWAAVELLEAATRSDNPGAARSALERIVAATEFASTDSARGILARSRAILSTGDTAERLYHEAIEHLSRSRLRPELARAHLLHGEWLRREGRRIDARESLRTAHEMLAEMGMEAFAGRARRELQATGERVRRRTLEARDDLTPQEGQIAELACDGLSNRDIGARLFLSSRTVEWHLSKVFGKLGVEHRKELATAMARSESGRTWT